MATSGATTFNLDIISAIEDAYERAGIEVRAGYKYRSARRSIDLMMLEWQNRGLNLWTIESGEIPLVAGTDTYYLPATTIDVIEAVYRPDSGADRTLRRYSISDYASVPTKTQAGTPTAMYISRVNIPEVKLWPVPSGATPGTFVYWRLRRIEDAGNLGSYNMDIPARFLPCFVAGLAYYLAQKVPDGQQRLPWLKAVYEEEWVNATEEDRERASFTIMPAYD